MVTFDKEFLGRLEMLALMVRRILRGNLRAEHLTKQRGSGIQFADYKEYMPGDDLRYLDWSAYARLGSTLIKLFEEEQDLHVYLLMDNSRSMNFGAANKREFALHMTAALAYIALHNLDRAGIAAYAERIVDEFPVGRGKERIHRMLQFLSALEESGEDTDLRQSIEEFLHVPRHRGVVIVVSDLFDPRGFAHGLDRLRFSNHQLFVVQVTADEEHDPDLLGDYDLEDMETSELVPVTVTERDAEKYRQVVAKFQDDLESYCRRYEVPLMKASSSENFEDVVMRMFKEGGLVR